LPGRGGRAGSGLLLGQVLVRHRRAREPLLVERLPGAVLHRRVQPLVQRGAPRAVALAENEAGWVVEAGDVDRDLERGISAGIVLGRLVIEEMCVDRAVVEGDYGG